MDYPALAKKANEESRKHKAIHYATIFVHLGALTCGTTAASLNIFDQDVRITISLILVFVSLAALFYSMNQNPVNVWYGCRAIAESVKTLAWRYAFCAAPFTDDLSEQEVDVVFCEKLKEILGEQKSLMWKLGRGFDVDRQITEDMLRSRRLSFAEKKDKYISERIKDQISWYSNKSEINKNRSNLLDALLILTHVFAMVIVGAIYIKPTVNINYVFVLVQLTTSIMAWKQTVESQKLAQSYSLTAFELNMIVEKGKHITEELTFVDFVNESERAISREHTLWVARQEAV